MSYLYSYCINRSQIHSMTEKKKICTAGNFVICDVQEEYAEHLLKILSEYFSGEYQFHLFYDFEKMKTFLQNSHPDVLLIGEEYKENLDSVSTGGSVIVLTEMSAKYAGERDRMVFRYQSADDIVKEISGIIGRTMPSKTVGDETEKRTARQKKGGIKIRDEPDTIGRQLVKGIIGIYSPIHRIGKTKYAIRLGRKLAKRVPVLYINMEGYSGMDYYFQDGTGKDLGDLLYCMKQERGDHGIKISAMTGQAGGMDYILPMENEQDLRSVKCEEWISLLDMIMEKCIYETIILDLGECVDGIYEILRKCERIYTPFIREGAAEAKLKQYENNLRLAGYGDILGRTVKKEMKRSAHSANSSRSMQRPEGTGSL